MPWGSAAYPGGSGTAIRYRVPIPLQDRLHLSGCSKGTGRGQDGAVDIVLARQRLIDAPVGRLGTVTREGRPHLVPCCFAFEGEVAYSAVDAKPKSTLRLRRLENILHEPAACLLVDYYDEDWASLWWVRLDGNCRIVDSPSEQESAKGALATKYPQYGKVAMPGPFIALEPSRWTAWP